MTGYVQNMSLALTEVLKDIGVTEKIVQKRRRGMLLQESISTIVSQLRGENTSQYIFGSKCEGTTTPGLHSDIDMVRCLHKYNVIQDLNDWEPGKSNYLMIQDDTVSPGYCKLQRLREDMPMPYDADPLDSHFRDTKGTLLLKNTLFYTATKEGVARHGPAFVEEGQPGYSDIDLVFAFPCKKWPTEARQWLEQKHIGHWPSNGMKSFCKTSGCFVVAVGSKESRNEELEWRISTSLAERCLMFNLNITQIQCYILMKMILKTFFKPQFGDVISSFMCKTMLFHCIAGTQPTVWRENNLLTCLSLCLSLLYICVSNENCPHFIIPQNNLMRGHISSDNKPRLLEILNNIVHSKGRKLLEIECHVFGKRLNLKLNYKPGLSQNLLQSLGLSELISGGLFYNFYGSMNTLLNECLSEMTHSSPEKIERTFWTHLYKLTKNFYKSKRMERRACNLLAPWFCTSLGSVQASLSIGLHNNVPQQALSWISLGLNSDVSSSRLKLASIFYCTGDIQKTVVELTDIDRRYDVQVVEPVCHSSEFFQHKLRNGFIKVSASQNEEAIQHVTAFPVTFLPAEVNCIPKELRYEMFRSTKEDLPLREEVDNWMDWAAVDSLPFLYFLQYKTYDKLARDKDKQSAFYNLVRTINHEPNLGHAETALNLMGQCMEQEDRVVDALQCYLLSIKLRDRNNAANIHICRLLSTMVNNK